jgi:hypothetical protein
MRISTSSAFLVFVTTASLSRLTTPADLLGWSLDEMDKAI